MRKVRKNVAVIKTGHGELGNDHFQESTESRKNTKFVFIETETGSSRKVATFHNSGGYKNFWVPLVDNFETS